MNWVDVKESLPSKGEIVKVKMRILFTTEKEAMYVRKYFVHQAENITKWVTHWKPIDVKDHPV